MKRCIIITAYNQNKIADAVEITQDDFIICADGGYDIAAAEGIAPDIVIGDMDSSVCEYPEDTIVAPTEKDDTDTILCIDYGVSKGYTDFVIVGGIGGRLDHTFANLQTLEYAREKGANALLTDGKNSAFIVTDRAEIPKEEGKTLSVFAYSEKCTGVYIKGTKYTLQNAELKSGYPIGVSNEILEENAEISLKEGKLLIITSEK